MTGKSYCFASFVLDLSRQAVRGSAGDVSLRPKSFEVLCYLLQHGGRVVGKDELIGAVWTDVTVSDESVTRCISDIRRALDDDDQRIIKTISRRGYLLDVPVTIEDGLSQSSLSQSNSPKPGGPAYVTRPTSNSGRGADAAQPALSDQHPLQGTVQAHGPERRQITILACSLVDASAHSAQLDPEDLHELTSAFHRIVREVVERHGGFNARSTADGAVGYFGYPLAHEDDAERAVHAALAAEKAIAGLAPASIAGGVKARFGIATGLVVVGDMGTEGTSEHILVGEAPLLAANLCTSAKAGTVLIAAATRRQLGGLFEFDDLDVADRQHSTVLADATVVLRESAVASRFDALQRSSGTPFVGRVDELETLLRLWGQAASVAGRVVQIIGEPGIGKSRLTQALLDRLEGEPYVRLRYFCQPNYTDSPLHPIIGQISEAAGIARHDDASQRLAKLEQLLRGAGQSPEDKIPLLAPLLSIPLGPSYPPLTLSPQRRKERTFNALTDLLSGVADRKTILMVFEDAHWIDPTSLELLTLLVDKVPKMPLLLIITARPEFTPSWPMHSHVSLLHLGRLGQSDGEALAQGVVHGRRLPKELLRAISNQTDGVPLFVEELTRSVFESGVLQEEGDGFVLKQPLLTLSIPSTLHASLNARLDRLGASKRVAQIAAVIGREFPYGLLAAVADVPEANVQAALDRLVATGLVFRRGLPPDSTYHFKHALMRDAAYESLLRGNRRALHAAIVGHLTAPDAGDEPVKPELIGHHCAAAGMVDAAVGHFLVAGAAAVTRSALTESSALFEKALAQVAQLPEGVPVHFMVGLVAPRKQKNPGAQSAWLAQP